MNNKEPEEYDRDLLLYTWYALRVSEYMGLEDKFKELSYFQIRPLREILDEKNMYFEKCINYLFFYSIISEIYFQSEDIEYHFRSTELAEYKKIITDSYSEDYGKINIDRATTIIGDLLELWWSGKFYIEQNSKRWNYQDPKVQLENVLQKIFLYLCKGNHGSILYKITEKFPTIDEITPLLYLDFYKKIKVHPIYYIGNRAEIEIELLEGFIDEYKQFEPTESRKNRLKRASKKIFDGISLINGSQKIGLGSYELRFCEYFFDLQFLKEEANIDDIIYHVYGESESIGTNQISQLKKGICEKAKKLGISKKLFTSIGGRIIKNHILDEENYTVITETSKTL